MTRLPLPTRKFWGGPFKPSFGLSGVVADPNFRVIRSSLTCLRQVESGMNNVCEAVITAVTPNGSATLPFVIPSEPGFPATRHKTGPHVRLSVRKGA
jgi:hypothetical protein